MIRKEKLLYLLAGVAFAVRAIEALRRPLHTDERISLSYASLPLKTTIAVLHFEDVHPPLYFLFLHVLGLSHTPEWAPRLLMVALGAAAVGIFFATVRLWAGAPAATVAGICAAFMPSLVFYDTWVRMYVVFDALVLLEFLLLSILLVRSDLAVLHRRALWAGWTVAAALAAYTLYLAWFIALAQLLYVVVVHREKVGSAIFAFGTALVLWLPQLPVFLYQTRVGGVNFGGYRAHELPAFLLLPGQATVAPQLEGNAASIAALIVWIWLAVGLRGALTLSRRSLLPWMGAPAALTLVYSIAVHKLIYLDRYYLIFAYALAAWMGCLFTLALEKKKPQLAIGVAAATAAVAIAGLTFAVDPAFYTANWPGVAAVLQTEAQPGDLILLEQGMSSWSLWRHRDIAKHPHVFVWFPNEIRKAADAASSHRRVWLVAYEPRGVDPNLVLLSQLQQKFRLTNFHQFTRALPAEDVSVGLFVR